MAAFLEPRRHHVWAPRGKSPRSRAPSSTTLENLPTRKPSTFTERGIPEPWTGYTRTRTSSRGLRTRSGTIAFSAAYPTGMTANAFSLRDRPRISPRNRIGLGVWVSGQACQMRHPQAARPGHRRGERARHRGCGMTASAVLMLVVGIVCLLCQLCGIVQSFRTCGSRDARLRKDLCWAWRGPPILR